MLFNVPQYVDVEDKVAGPLTAKQLFWMIGMGAVLLVLWNIFEFAAFSVIAIPVIILFVAFAFYRPYGQPLITFVSHALFFIFRPKVYVWDRPEQPEIPTVIKASKKPDAKQEKQEGQASPREELTPERIRELSFILDNKNTHQNQ